MSELHNPPRYLVDEKVCPYCIEKTRVVSRLFKLLPTIRKCDSCKRSWDTGW